MSIENKSVGIAQDSKYCAECGARMAKMLKVCPACGESQA